MRKNKNKTSPADRIDKIADRLRRRQLERGLATEANLSALSSRQLCWCYLTCNRCGERLVPALGPVVRRTRTADGFVTAANLLLTLHEVEAHGAKAFTGEPADGGTALTAADLREQVRAVLGPACPTPGPEAGLPDGETVWGGAVRWAAARFAGLAGGPHTPEELTATCGRLAEEYPGVETGRWLFVYSPASANPVFEVSADPIRLMVASAKLGTVAAHGGMLFEADFSGAAGPNGRYRPLVVCKP